MNPLYSPHGTPQATRRCSKGNSRQKFSKEEDDQLCRLVHQYGVNNWNFVADRMQTRSARQCRERYVNYLSPDVRNGKWTAEEETLLRQMVEEHGPRWTRIVQYFPGRSAVNLKNQWSVLSSKMARAIEALSLLKTKSRKRRKRTTEPHQSGSSVASKFTIETPSPSNISSNDIDDMFLDADCWEDFVQPNDFFLSS